MHDRHSARDLLRQSRDLLLQQHAQITALLDSNKLHDDDDDEFFCEICDANETDELDDLFDDMLASRPACGKHVTAEDLPTVREEYRLFPDMLVYLTPGMPARDRQSFLSWIDQQHIEDLDLFQRVMQAVRIVRS